MDKHDAATATVRYAASVDKGVAVIGGRARFHQLYAVLDILAWTAKCGVRISPIPWGSSRRH